MEILRECFPFKEYIAKHSITIGAWLLVKFTSEKKLKIKRKKVKFSCRFTVQIAVKR